MNSPSSENSPGAVKRDFDGFRLAGCCMGQALGCGFSFIVTWGIALILSAVLAPLFGKFQEGNTPIGLLLTALTCGSSLFIGAGLSFLTGRLFPVFKKKVR